MTTQAANFLIRRAEVRDAVGIRQLITDNCEQTDMFATLTKRYGHTNILTFLDTTSFSIVATDLDDTKILAFTVLENHPIPEVVKTNAGEDQRGLIQGDWSVWLRERYECRDVQLHNTKFLHFFFSHPPLTNLILQHSLVSIFTAMPNLQYIAYLLPDSVLPFPPLSSESVVHKKKGKPRKKMTTAAATATSSATQTRFFKERTVLRQDEPYSLNISSREDFCPKLNLRDARVEDCDDLVPMFRKQKILDEEQGDFYLAQLLESKNDKSRTLVAESAQGTVVGFMSLSTQINYETLQQNFYLDVYDSLVYDSAEAHAKATRVAASRASTRKKLRSASSKSEIGSMDEEGILQIGEEIGIGDQESSARLGESDHVDSGGKHSAEVPQQNTENAFTVTLFCMEDAYANQAGEFLTAAFSKFPDRDYCLLSLPTTIPDFPLLQSFTKVASKPDRSAAHALYLCNRYGNNAVVSVRSGLAADITSIEEMVSSLPSAPAILTRTAKALGAVLSNDVNYGLLAIEEFPNVQCYVAEAHGVVVGIAIIDDASEADVEAGFDVEEFIVPSIQRQQLQLQKGDLSPDRQIRWLRHLIVNPLFAHQTRWLLEEVLRQSGTTTFYYAVDANSASDLATRSRVFPEFLNVQRRRRTQYPNNMNDLTRVPPPRLYPILLFTKNILYERKVYINSRLIVVGSSDAGLSLLERLIYRSHLLFTNITLISVEGIPTFEEGKHFVTQRCFTSEEIKQLGLHNYVRVIKSQCSNIDRDAKTCQLSDGSLVSYDYLVLTPGLQYQISDLFGATEADLKNVITVNRYNAEEVRAGMRMLSESKRRLNSGRSGDKGANSISAEEMPWEVVWGRDLQAYALIQGIIEQGGDATRIALVLPPGAPHQNNAEIQTITGNAEVDAMIQTAIKKLNITVFRNSVLKSHVAGLTSLKSITIENIETKETTTLSVAVLFYCGKRSINPDTFHSVNDSCLVFDGHLVTDRYFHTQDPFIFAAGSVTKYSSRYQTRWFHEYLDSREVGAKVANKILPMFDPITKPEKEEDNGELPTFSEAKKVECYLPNGYYYLHFDKPRLPNLNLEVRKLQPDHGRELITRTEGPENESYFRIHLDPKGYIQSITYLGQQIIPSDNILCLNGLHESYLNRLVSRFDEGIIKDFAAFFNQTWAMTVYHDQFRNFLKGSRREMFAEAGPATQEIVQSLQNYLASNTKIPEKERAAMYKSFDCSPDRPLYDKKVKELLRYIA